MKELTQENMNVLGERVRHLMGNAAESSLALMIRDLGKQISECGENRLDVVFRLGFELDDRGDYCFDLGLDWTRKIKHKDSFETVRVNFDQPPLPGMEDDGGDVAKSGKKAASVKAEPKQIGGEAVRLLGPGPVADIETTARPVGEDAEPKMCGGCKHMKDEEYCESSDPLSVACGDFEAAEQSRESTGSWTAGFRMLAISDTDVFGDTLTGLGFEQAPEQLSISNDELEVIMKLEDVGMFVMSYVRETKSLVVFVGIGWDVPVGGGKDVNARARAYTRYYPTSAAAEREFKKFIAMPGVMFLNHERLVPGKINALYRVRPWKNNLVVVSDDGGSWRNAEEQSLEYWYKRADAIPG